MNAFAIALGLAIAGVVATAATVGTPRVAPARTELAPDIDVCSSAHLEYLRQRLAWLDAEIAAHDRPFRPGSRYRLASQYDGERARVAETLAQCVAGI